MRTTRLACVVISTLFLATSSLTASMNQGFQLDVIVDGVSRPQYSHRGTTYIEALRGRDYTLRLTNPTPYRVAAALSVDGLNSIDARHTDGWNAAKWVIEPYGSIEISGWQVSDRAARRFVFTGERSSYGAALGQTENLGVIAAVVYRERARPIVQYQAPREEATAGARDSAADDAAPRSAAAMSESGKGLSEEYAATGMGGRTEHSVRRVSMELERHPISSIKIRYEFRPQLIELGVIDRFPAPIQRRERSRGFGGFAPEPR